MSYAARLVATGAVPRFDRASTLRRGKAYNAVESTAGQVGRGPGTHESAFTVSPPFHPITDSGGIGQKARVFGRSSMGSPRRR